MSLIPSAPLKLGRVPALTHVLPPTSTSRFCPSMSLAPPRLHSRRYLRDFALITRTARCLRQLPLLRCCLPARFPMATCSMSLIPFTSLYLALLPPRSTASSRLNRPCRSPLIAPFAGSGQAYCAPRSKTDSFSQRLFVSERRASKRERLTPPRP